MDSGSKENTGIRNLSTFLKSSKIKLGALFIGITLITSISLLIINIGIPQNEDPQLDSDYQFPYTVTMANGEIFNFSDR